MVYGPIHYDEETGDVILSFNKTDPATGTPFPEAAVTSLTYEVWDLTTTPASSLDNGSCAWDSAAETWKATIPLTAFLGQRTVLWTLYPTRDAGTPPALWPQTAIPLDCTNIINTLNTLESDLSANTRRGSYIDRLPTETIK